MLQGPSLVSVETATTRYHMPHLPPLLFFLSKRFDEVCNRFSHLTAKYPVLISIFHPTAVPTSHLLQSSLERHDGSLVQVRLGDPGFPEPPSSPRLKVFASLKELSVVRIVAKTVLL